MYELLFIYYIVTIIIFGAFIFDGNNDHAFIWIDIAVIILFSWVAVPVLILILIGRIISYLFRLCH